MSDLLPKILIVSRLVWDDNSNSNTLSNIFANYDPKRIARIYIETKTPNTKCCNHFFQISEISLLNKIFNWNIKTGREIQTSQSEYSLEAESLNNNLAHTEARTMQFVRGHRSFLFTLMREFLWYLNGWKSKELKKFVEDFNPDIIWLDGSPLILMNRLNNYVASLLKDTPVVTFLMDDVYTYKSCPDFNNRIFKFFLRKHVRKTVKRASHVFVSSLKMKEEYDRIFEVNSTFLTKRIETQNLRASVKAKGEPTRLIYLGNVLIGRLQTLIEISKVIKQINTSGIQITLDIYTGDFIPEKQKEALSVEGVKLHKPVPYNEVPKLINNSDAQVFVESLEGAKSKIARLSFSTKIIDYLTSGKCILAVGSSDLAPIEYFKNEDAALVATSQDEISDALLQLTDINIVNEYAQKAVNCGIRNHERNKLDNQLVLILKSLAK